jgi:NAD(P)-dependent dehydrogenase (short-subunit alcohol dehydrogenase family)
MAAIADVTDKGLGELLSLAGRRAVVTGGARGLGRAIADRLAQAGASVLIGDCNADGAIAAANAIADKRGVRAIGTMLDVADGASIANCARQAEETLGGIDIWVNNAGVFPATPALEMTDDAWDQVMDINLRGVFIGCREAARSMVAAGNGGVIVNIASTAGLRGTGPRVSHYVASKHGVTGLTKQLALEFGPERIRVLGIAPSVIVTEGVKASQAQNEAGGSSAFSFQCVLGRLGVPDDIARVALFCASDMSLYMTGTTIPVDAGLLI